jgi:hypothetical protein
MNESKAGRKIRRHKAAVGFFEVAVASEKRGTSCLSPRFPPSGCVRGKQSTAMVSAESEEMTLPAVVKTP